MGSINTDPYHRPSHRANHLRELDGFTYPDGTRIHRGDGVTAAGEPAHGPGTVRVWNPLRTL